MSTATGERGLLADLRVVEVATMVFAPSACAMLADFGADVIKVEPPGTGDLNRHYHKLPGMPVSELPYTFQADNRNKRSLAVDLKSEEGLRIVRELLATADVFVTNYRPAALAKLRLSFDDLRELNPRLIYALGSGYGEEGEERDNPGYDSVCYWSRSGIESQVFPLDSWLGPFPYGSGDHPSGTALFAAVMLGLYQREQTGRGVKVSTSLLANGTWANATMLQAQLAGAAFTERRPRDRSYNFTYIHYKTRDGRILKLCIVNAEKDWKPFCRAIGREDLIDDPRFARLDARVENMSTLIGLIDAAFAEHDIAYWAARLRECDIPHSILPTYPEAAADSQKHANRIVVPLEHPKHGTIATVSSPIEVAGYPKERATAAPELGEHSTEILQGLGWSSEEISRLVDSGIVQRQSTP